MEQLRLGQAICLLLKLDPESRLGGHVSRMSPSNEFSTAQRALFAQAKNMWDVAWASYNQGSLRMDAGMHATFVAMSDWLAWAQAKNYHIPDELADLVPVQGKGTLDVPNYAGGVTWVDAQYDKRLAPVDSQESDELNQKKENTLLVIIAALARELEIDLEHPSKAAQTIALLTEKLGSPVGARAIETHVKAARRAVQARSK